MLPNTYDRLDYIQSNGNQYINTGIKGYTAFKLKFQLLNTGSQQYGIFGSRQSGGSNRFGCMIYSGLFHFMIGNNNMWNIASNTNVHELDFNSTRLFDNGTEYETPSGQSYGSSDFYLFAMNLNSSGRIAQKIWYFQTLDEDGNITKNLIPAKRKSDNVIGLYDDINDVFYTNAGSGSFTYGSIVYSVDATATPTEGGIITGTGDYPSGDNVSLQANANSGYAFDYWELDGFTRLEYIESTGTQYIDLGVNCTRNIEFELDVAFTEITGSTKTIIGATTNGNQSMIAVNSNEYYVRWAEGTGVNGNIDTSFHTFKLENNELYFDAIYVTSSGAGYSNTSLNLFRNNYSSNYQYCKAKLKYCVIKENDIIIRNYIPVIRHSDGAIGLLDLVEMKFYGNSGTGTFIGGDVYAS